MWSGSPQYRSFCEGCLTCQSPKECAVCCRERHNNSNMSLKHRKFIFTYTLYGDLQLLSEQQMQAGILWISMHVMHGMFPLLVQFSAFSFLDLNTDFCIRTSVSYDAVAAIKCCYSPSHHSCV